MALSKWTDKINGKDYVNADDINNIARAILELENRPVTPSEPANGSITSEKLATDSVTTGKIKDGSVTKEKTSFIEKNPVYGKNLFDVSAVLEGFIVNPNGGVSANANYFASDFIEVDQAKNYCLSIHYSNASTVVIAFYSDNAANAVPLKNPLQGEYANIKVKNDATVDGLTRLYLVLGENGDFAFPSGTKYFRFCMFPARLSNSIQFEEGAFPTSLEDFGIIEYEYRFDKSIKVPSTEEVAALVEKVENLENSGSEQEKPLFVSVGENDISIVGKIGKSQKIQIDGMLKYSTGNDQFNLTLRTISKDGVIQIKDDGATDDLPPISMNYGNVGANHGYEFVNIRFNAPVEIGQKITRTSDGTEFLCVDDDVFVVSCYEDANGLWQKNDDGSTDKIIVGEAFKDEASTEFIVQANATFVRYKSANHHKYSFVVDGEKTTEHKNYNCDTFTIKETYDIISYKGLWDFYANNANSGVSYDDAREDLPVCMTVENIYTFDERCSMVVNTTFRAVEKIKIQQAGVIQNYLLAKDAADSEYMYVNNTFEKNGVDLSTFINVNDLPTDGVSFNGTEFGENGVANRNVLWVTSAGGEKKYGLTTGFIPDLSYSKDNNRKPLLGAIWQVYHTKKSYPYGVRVKTMNVGESLTFLAYRSYLPEETPVTNFNIVDVGNSAYLFIDAHEEGVFTVEIDSRYYSRTIEALEQNGIEMSSDVVGSSLSFSVLKDRGNAVFKLK